MIALQTKLKQGPQLRLQVHASWSTESPGKHFTGFRTVVSLQEVVARLEIYVAMFAQWCACTIMRQATQNVFHQLTSYIRCRVRCPSKCLRVGGL